MTNVSPLSSPGHRRAKVQWTALAIAWIAVVVTVLLVLYLTTPPG